MSRARKTSPENDVIVEGPKMYVPGPGVDKATQDMADKFGATVHDYEGNQLYPEVDNG